MERSELINLYDMSEKNYTALHNAAFLSCAQAAEILDLKTVGNEQCVGFQAMVENQINVLHNLQSNLISAHAQCNNNYNLLKSAGHTKNGLFSESIANVNRTQSSLSTQISSYLTRLNNLNNALKKHINANNLSSFNKDNSKSY